MKIRCTTSEQNSYSSIRWLSVSSPLGFGCAASPSTDLANAFVDSVLNAARSNAKSVEYTVYIYIYIYIYIYVLLFNPSLVATVCRQVGGGARGANDASSRIVKMVSDVSAPVVGMAHLAP